MPSVASEVGMSAAAPGALAPGAAPGALVPGAGHPTIVPGAAPLRWSERAKPIVALAPMDGITDTAYRQVVRRFDPHVVLFSEFTSADGFLRSAKVRRRLAFRPEEQPYFVQLFGNTPGHFVEAARALEDQGVAGIDINMGCPSKKVVASQHGSGLMRDADTACRIVEAIATACRVDVSVKTRLGWRDASGLAAFARALAGAGASLITIHGRTYDQSFGGRADWGPIQALKDHLAVPVLGNGDVQHFDDGMARLGRLDGFMIGRAAIGNPWVFLRDPARRAPTMAERVETISLHYRLLREALCADPTVKAHIDPVHLALVEFRKHLVGYLRGFPLAKQARVALLQANDEASFQRLVDGLLELPLAA
jgi:nifR3 family TIM-barrel protein